MAYAQPVKAGDAQLSAGRTLNPVVEQANRLADFGGGPGIMSQNDPTGLQMRGRRRDIADGDSPYSSSASWRRTMHRRKDGTRHSNEWELFNSATVSTWGVVPSSSRPQRYGVPYLLTDVDGNADLNWAHMDADERGSSGPRSLERRSSSSGVRFQLYAFDSPPSALDSSEAYEVAVRRRYGSSDNHYIAWVDSAGLGGLSLHPWGVSVSGNNATVLAGLRSVVGGTQSTNTETIVALTDAQLAAGVYLVKQFSGGLGEWVEDIQVVDDLPRDVVANASIDFTAETWNLFPDTLDRQIRVIAFVSSAAIYQYANGTIYAVSTNDSGYAGGGDDVPLESADEVDGICDQNTHPGDPDYDTDPDHPGEEGEGGEDGTDQDNTDHPAAEDCYTTGDPTT